MRVGVTAKGRGAAHRALVRGGSGAARLGPVPMTPSAMSGSCRGKCEDAQCEQATDTGGGGIREDANGFGVRGAGQAFGGGGGQIGPPGVWLTHPPTHPPTSENFSSGKK